MSDFSKTRKLLDEFEKMSFDYDGCINKQIEIIKSIIYNAGNSGFSASCVGLGVIRETHSLKGPFRLITLDDELYPQSDPLEKQAEKFVEENKQWLGKEARKNLKNSPDAHPAVIAHWKILSKIRKPRAKKK